MTPARTKLQMARDQGDLAHLQKAYASRSSPRRVVPWNTVCTWPARAGVGGVGHRAALTWAYTPCRHDRWRCTAMKWSA